MNTYKPIKRPQEHNRNCRSRYFCLYRYIPVDMYSTYVYIHRYSIYLYGIYMHVHIYYICIYCEYMCMLDYTYIV